MRQIFIPLLFINNFLCLQKVLKSPQEVLSPHQGCAGRGIAEVALAQPGAGVTSAQGLWKVWAVPAVPGASGDAVQHS